MISAPLLLALAVPLLDAGAPAGPAVVGDYIESRTADVFTGPCFANAQVFITGNQALMAWKVTRGTFQGQDLSGLAVAAAVTGNTTFSKDNPKEAESVLIVDDCATPAQRAALVALAQELGGERLSRVVAVQTARMNVFVESHEATSEATAAASHHAFAMPHAPQGTFWAAGLAEIQTRPLDDSDHLCGNEVVEYQPLSAGVTALPAYTLSNTFKGSGLGTRWYDHNNRGSFVGRFAH